MHQTSVDPLAVMKQNRKYEPARKNASDARDRHGLQPRAPADGPDERVRQILDHIQRADDQERFQQSRFGK